MLRHAPTPATRARPRTGKEREVCGWVGVPAPTWRTTHTDAPPRRGSAVAPPATSPPPPGTLWVWVRAGVSGRGRRAGAASCAPRLLLPPPPSRTRACHQHGFVPGDAGANELREGGVGGWVRSWGALLHSKGHPSSAALLRCTPAHTPTARPPPPQHTHLHDADVPTGAQQGSLLDECLPAARISHAAQHLHERGSVGGWVGGRVHPLELPPPAHTRTHTRAAHTQHHTPPLPHTHPPTQPSHTHPLPPSHPPTPTPPP